MEYPYFVVPAGAEEAAVVISAYRPFSLSPFASIMKRRGMLPQQNGSSRSAKRNGFMRY